MFSIVAYRATVYHTGVAAILPQYGRQYYCGYVHRAKFGQKSVSHSLHMKPINVWLDPILQRPGRVQPAIS